MECILTQVVMAFNLNTLKDEQVRFYECRTRFEVMHKTEPEHINYVILDDGSVRWYVELQEKGK